MPQLGNISIRAMLGALVGVMGLLLVVLTGTELLKSEQHYNEASRIQAVAQISRSLFKTLITLRNERAAASNALAGQNPVGAKTASDMFGFRLASEAAFAESITRLEQLAQPAFAEAAARLKAAHDVMAGLRTRVDTLIKRSLADRDPILLRDYFALVQPFVDVIISAGDQLEASMKLVDPTVDELLSIKRAAWTSRLYAGLMALRIEVAVAGGKSFSQADVLAWSQDSARARLAWALVTEAAARPDAPKSITDGVAIANRNFVGSGADDQSAVFETLAAGQKVTLPLEGLRVSNTANLTALADVAAVALDEAAARALQQAQASGRTLVFDAAVLQVAVSFQAWASSPCSAGSAGRSTR